MEVNIGEQMKVLVMSDSHGLHKNIERVLALESPIDMFIHLGDVESDEAFIMARITCEKHIVRGNNDFFSSLPREELVQIGSHLAFLTHGHNYYVSFDSQMIIEEALARGADIVMYGHTHKPLLQIEDEITVLNPGSISLPRQKEKKPSYAVLDVSENGEITYDIRCLKD